MGVEGADLPILSEIVVRTPMRLRGLNFNELFVWLSRSMHVVSDSKVGDQVALQPPGGRSSIDLQGIALAER